MTAVPTHRQLVDDHEKAATIVAHLEWESRQARHRAAIHRAVAAARHAATVTARAVTTLAPLAWLTAAGMAGAMLEAAGRARADGDEALTWALAVPAALLAGAAVKAALTETMTAHAARRRGERAAVRAADLRAANSALRKRNRALWARAIHWQEIAESETRAADIAMRHTPLGQTLADIRTLRDTRERST